MPLTVLDGAAVKSVLFNLTIDEVKGLQKNLRDALHQYSGDITQGTEENNQPERTQLDRKNGTTTLFMPSNASSGTAVKGVPPPHSPDQVIWIDAVD